MSAHQRDLAEILLRLRPAQDQLGGVIAMVEQGRECRDIVNQLAAVSKALDRAGFTLVASGLRECINSDRSDSAGCLNQRELEKLFLALA